jgi:hypothetical protein
MELRSGHVAGPPLQLPSQEAKAGFEEGVGLVFSQWTALCLAVEQEWGGHESEDKANFLIDEVIQWFYKKKGKQRPTSSGGCLCCLLPFSNSSGLN